MLIEASGTYAAVHEDTIASTIADMLRYDGGTILEVLEDEPTEWRSLRKFKVLVDCQTYTPERWKSFNIKTKEVGSESLTKQDLWKVKKRGKPFSGPL